MYETCTGVFRVVVDVMSPMNGARWAEIKHQTHVWIETMRGLISGDDFAPRAVKNLTAFLKTRLNSRSRKSWTKPHTQYVEYRNFCEHILLITVARSMTGSSPVKEQSPSSRWCLRWLACGPLLGAPHSQVHKLEHSLKAELAGLIRGEVLDGGGLGH